VLEYLLVESSSGKKSGELLKKIKNDYSAAAKGKGDLVYPKDLADAETRVSTYRPMMASTTFKKDHNKNLLDSDTEDEVPKNTFVQPGTNNIGGEKEINCFRSGQMGPYASDCQESLPTETGTDIVNNGWGKEGNSGRKAAQFMIRKSITLQGTKEEYAHLRKSVVLDNQPTADHKKRSLKLGHVSTSTRPSATALPGSPVSRAL
jgi:hypothetical protein